MHGEGFHWRRRERRRQRAAYGIAGLATIVAMIASAGCHDRQRHGRWGDDQRSADARIDRALDWLDVEGDARERARTIAQRLVEQATALQADGTQLAGELLTQWSREQPEAARLHEVLDRQVDDLRARAHQVVDDVLALHATLDAEQRAEVADVAERMRGGRHRGHRW